MTTPPPGASPQPPLFSHQLPPPAPVLMPPTAGRFHYFVRLDLTSPDISGLNAGALTHVVKNCSSVRAASYRAIKYWLARGWIKSRPQVNTEWESLFEGVIVQKIIV